MTTLTTDKTVIFILILWGAFACSAFNRTHFVSFDEASLVCRESRELVTIESKMIPSDEALGNEAKEKAGTDITIQASPEAKTDYKLIDEDAEERFVTIPKNRFASVTLANGRHLVYWIHFVSSNETTLDAIEAEESAHFEKISAVLKQFQESGKLKTPGWENELNDAILKEVKTISKFDKVSRVFIHLGC